VTPFEARHPLVHLFYKSDSSMILPFVKLVLSEIFFIALTPATLFGSP